MSSIPYSGGTIVNTTFTCVTGTRAEIVSGLGAILVTAGWTSLGSGLYKSGTTAAPKGNSVRVRIVDAGGTCAQIKLEDDSGTKVSTGVFLLPGVGKIYRVIACQYNFFVFVPGTSQGREFVCGGTLYIPDFLNGVVVGSLGWLQGNGYVDYDAAVRRSFRTRLNCYESNSARQVFLRNDILLDLINMNSANASHNLLMQSHGFSDNFNQSYRWSDDSIGIMEAIFCAGISSQTDESKRQGIIHNCMIVSDVFPADTIPTAAYDGHNWWAITDGNTGSQQDSRGTLFVATN